MHFAPCVIDRTYILENQERSVTVDTAHLSSMSVMAADNQDNEYEHYARDCVRLAGLATDQLLREKLMEMARQWMGMAMGEPQSPAPTKGSELT